MGNPKMLPQYLFFMFTVLTNYAIGPTCTGTRVPTSPFLPLTFIQGTGPQEILPVVHGSSEKMRRPKYDTRYSS